MGKISIPTPIQVSTERVTERDPSEVGVQIDNPLEAATQQIVESVRAEETLDDFDTEIQLLPLKRHFGIDIHDVSRNDKLEWLMNWAKEIGIWGKNKLMEEIRNIEFKIGVGTMGESKVHAVYNYLRADKEAREAAARVHRMEANAIKG